MCHKTAATCVPHCCLALAWSISYLPVFIYKYKGRAPVQLSTPCKSRYWCLFIAPCLQRAHGEGKRCHSQGKADGLNQSPHRGAWGASQKNHNSQQEINYPNRSKHILVSQLLSPYNLHKTQSRIPSLKSISKAQLSSPVFELGSHSESQTVSLTDPQMVSSFSKGFLGHLGKNPPKVLQTALPWTA